MDPIFPIIAIGVLVTWRASKKKQAHEKAIIQREQQRKEAAAPRPSEAECPVVGCGSTLSVQGLSDLVYRCPTHGWFRRCRAQSESGQYCDGLAKSKFLPKDTPAKRRRASVAISGTRCAEHRSKPQRKQAKSGKRGSTGKKAKIPKGLRHDVLARDESTCQMCGRKAPEVKLHVDHIKPESKGGPTTLDNLQVLCADCNLGKGDKYSV